MRHRLRVLIVTHAFPPMNSTASHRPYSWARAWSDLGHEVHVLTPTKHPFDGTMDLERDLSGVQIHEVPYLPLARSRSDGAQEGRVARWEWLKTLTRRVRFSVGLFGDLRLLSYRPMVRRGREILRRRRFDFIIATAPPEGILAVARALSGAATLPWVADFRDVWFHDLVLYRWRLVCWLLGPINRWLVKTATALVTVSRGLEERLARYLGRDVIVSYNGFIEADRVAGTACPGGCDRGIHLVYTGRIYPGRQDPEPLFCALADLRSMVADLPARIAVDYYGFVEPWMRSLIVRYGLEDCVKLHGFVPYRESLDAQRAADVLLFLDWTEPRAEGMLTGKLFEYLASGRPILALGTRKDSEAARLIAEAGCGSILTEHAEIVDYLKQLLAGPRPLATESAAVERFSRERQARTLLTTIMDQLR